MSVSASLGQDQFAFEDVRVLDVVMMGHAEMWAAMSERDAIYANPDASEEDYMRAADLEAAFAEYDGYTAEPRAGNCCSASALLSQYTARWAPAARAAGAGVVLQPGRAAARRTTNNLDINTIPLAGKHPQRALLHHDHHLARPPLPEQRVHPHGPPGLQHHHAPTRGTYDEYMMASRRRASGNSPDNAKAKEKIAELNAFVARFSANASKAKPPAAPAQTDKIKDTWSKSNRPAARAPLHPLRIR